jgi:hypothetical protein
MADQYVVRTAGIGLAANTTLCLVAISTGARQININNIRVSSQGATGGTIYFALGRINNTPVGSGNYSQMNQDPAHPADGLTAAAAASTANPGAWTTAPTVGGGLYPWEMYVPIGQGWSEWWPQGQEVDTKANDWIGLFATSSVAVANTTAQYGAFAAITYTI